MSSNRTITSNTPCDPDGHCCCWGLKQSMCSVAWCCGLQYEAAVLCVTHSICGCCPVRLQAAITYVAAMLLFSTVVVGDIRGVVNGAWGVLHSCAVPGGSHAARQHAWVTNHCGCVLLCVVCQSTPQLGARAMGTCTATTPCTACSPANAAAPSAALYLVA